MADIPNELAKKSLEKLMDWAIGEARYICCFTSIAADCEKEREKLEAKVKAVVQRVDQLRRSAQDTPVDVTSLEKRASELIQEDTRKKNTCFFAWCPNCIWRYSRGKKLANKTEDIRRIMQEIESLNITGLTPHLPGVEYHSSQDYVSFESRELKYKEILDALTDDNNYITGLQGMGGSGKTTLAIKVAQELKQSKQFDLVIDTTVSSTPDIRKIQDDIAVPLGLASELKDKADSERPKLLHNRLTNGEKILLILDDVWENTMEHINFETIGIPKRGLITTRHLRACRLLECDKIIELQLLPEDEAWTLFEKHARINDNTSKSLAAIGHEIVKECKGLLVAIAIIASHLKGEHRQEQWNGALISLQKPMYGVNKDLNEIYKCLWYSYDNMNNEEAKRLFFLCSLFPEDEEIPAEILTRFGIGAGLFGEVYDKYDDVRTKVAVAKNELIDSCLLLKSEHGHVKMHDLVREVALLKVSKEIRAVNLSDKHQKSLVKRENGMKYLLLEGNDKDVFSYMFDGSELEILKISCMVKGRDSMEMPNSFLENMTKLRVLDLSYQDWGWRHSLSLPRSIESLTNIRSIFFENLTLGDISILGKLQSLEALDLAGCEVVELPCEITELERLRLLRLYYCSYERNNAFEVIERCLSLEELYFISFEIDSSSIDKKIILPTLQRYHIKNGYDFKTHDSMPKHVCVSDIDTCFSEKTFKYLMQTAQILELKGDKGEWRNLIPEIISIDEGMNDLVQLFLESYSKLQCLIDNWQIDSMEQNVFSKLAVLELENMENFEELCNGPLPFDFLKSLEMLSIKQCKGLRSILFKNKLNLVNLKTIKLQFCPRLVSLFPLSASQSLVLLEELEIRYCAQLQNIIADERIWEELGEKIVGADNVNRRKSPHSMFPNLKILTISNCPLLEFILSVFPDRDIPVLEFVTIEECAELKYIFGKYQHENEELDLHQEVKGVILGSLQEMNLTDLPNFIDIFQESDHPKCSSTKRSSSKSQMQSDPMKCNIFPWTHKYRHKWRSTTSAQTPLVSNDQLHHCSTSSASNHLWKHIKCLSKQSQMLRNVKMIQLWGVSKIESVFIMSIAPTMILETLIIENCDNLKHIIVGTRDDRGGNNWGNVFPKLVLLSVEGCGQLEYIFGHYPNNHQNHNEIQLHLPTLKYLKFHKLPKLIGICSEDYRITFLPFLTDLTLGECSHFNIKSIGDLSIHDSRELGSTTIKDLSGDVQYFLSLENPKVNDSKEISEQQMHLRFEKLRLGDLSLTYIFVGPNNSGTLENLEELAIVRCEKLEVIFSHSMLRCLPQLQNLMITECKELKQIIEEDTENEKISNFPSGKTCFPKLALLVVNKCNKLKCVFHVSTSKEFPKLKNVIIKEASELEEVFKCDQKIELSNLEIAILVKLPSLCSGIEFQTATSLFVHNCAKLSLISTVTIDEVQRLTEDAIAEFGWDSFLYRAEEDTVTEMREDIHKVGELDEEESNNKDTINQNPIAEITEDVPVGSDVQAASGRELISSHVNTDQQEDHIKPNEFISVETKTKQSLEAEHEFVDKVPALNIPSIAISPTHEAHSHGLVDEQNMVEQCLMNQQQTLGEIKITFKTLQGNNFLKETKDQSIQKDSTSEKTVTATMSTDSETRNTSLGPLLAPLEKSIKRSVEEVTTSANAKTITSSTHSESVSSLAGPLVTTEHNTYQPEDGDGQIATPSFSGVTTEPPTTKDVDVRDSQETSEFEVALTNTHALVSLNDDASMKVSSIIEEHICDPDEVGVSESKPSAIASKSPSVPFEGNPSRFVEDLNFASLDTRELEQLVSNKHLASENLSLLIDFLVKHPSVRLNDRTLSNRYKGYAYNSLAELLKFLQIHSVKDVLESSHSDFVELLQDVRKCGFDKDWLDDVERRALFLGIQVSQDALQKLLDSKLILTQHVEDLKHQLASSQAVLESIIQQEEQVLEARAALTAPIGY